MPTPATAVVLRLIREVVNHNDLSPIDELVHPDFYSHAAPPTRANGPTGVAATVRELHRTIAAFRIDPSDVITAGDKIVVRATASGRNLHPGTPRECEWSAEQIHIFRIVDGQIIEHWVAGEHQQLCGAAPARRRATPPSRRFQ